MRGGPLVVLSERLEKFLWILSRVILGNLDGCHTSFCFLDALEGMSLDFFGEQTALVVVCGGVHH